VGDECRDGRWTASAIRATTCRGGPHGARQLGRCGRTLWWSVARVTKRTHLPVYDVQLEHHDGSVSQDGWWVTPLTHWADEVLDRITGARDLVKRVHEVITDSPRRSDK
jgi:hypothetical protein